MGRIVRAWLPLVAVAVAAVASVSAPARADGDLPWVALAAVTDTARSGLAPDVTNLLQQSLAATDVNVVAAEDFAAAARTLGVPRTRWTERGALTGVAKAAGADFLIFATIERVGSALALRLTAVRPATSPDVIAREEVAFRGAPNAADVDAALRRLAAALAHVQAAPATTTTTTTTTTNTNTNTNTTTTTPTSTPQTPTPTAPPAPTSGDGTGVLLISGGVASSLAAAGALTVGVVFAVTAWTTSEALVTLPKGSPDRTAREAQSLEQAVYADVAFGSALVLGAVATTLFVVAASDASDDVSGASGRPARE